MRRSAAPGEAQPVAAAGAREENYRGTSAQLTVVTVTYNSSHILPRMLDSLPRGTPIVVVDNGSADSESTAEVAAKAGAKLIQNCENVGFGSACNQGAAVAKTELVLFLNPDAELTSGALEHLADATSRYPLAVAFSPVFRDAKGRMSYRRSSTIDPDSPKLPRELPESDWQVPILSGAALLVRKVAFDQIGGFDPNIHLYHEDDDLCLRLRATQGPLMLVPSAEVIHRRGHSTGKGARAYRSLGQQMGYSRVYASLKHRVPLAYTKAVLSAVGEICLLPRLLSARRRAKSLGYLSGVIEARHLIGQKTSIEQSK